MRGRNEAQMQAQVSKAFLDKSLHELREGEKVKKAKLEYVIAFRGGAISTVRMTLEDAEKYQREITGCEIYRLVPVKRKKGR